MSDDFYPFVDSGDPAPANTHLTGAVEPEVQPNSAVAGGGAPGTTAAAAPLRAARISVYDDMLSTPRVIVVEQSDIRTYLEDVTNTVYRTMKEQGGRLSLMIIRELVENFIHARFSEPIISILDNGDTIRFSDQGPGIGDKELAFEFGVTSADRDQKRYIRGTGSGLPMIQQYVENAGGAISIEDNLGAGTVVTVSVNPERVAEIEQSVSRGAAVRSGGQSAPVANQQMQTGGMAGAWSQPQAMDAHGSYAGGTVNPMQHMGMQTNAAMGQPYPSMGMNAGMGQVMQPGMVPGAQPGMAPGAQPGMAPGAQPGMAPGAQPGMQPGMYPQTQPQPYGYPQFGNQFSTIPQQYGQPAGMYPQQSAAPAAAMPAATPYVSERGLMALRFICENTSGGPTDLTRAYGSSNGTWSRELATLSKAGLVHKPGQKYVLTDAGRAWMHQHES